MRLECFFLFILTTLYIYIYIHNINQPVSVPPGPYKGLYDYALYIGWLNDPIQKRCPEINNTYQYFTTKFSLYLLFFVSPICFL